ncbi:aminoacyl-tRNA hydrolase [Helicobacter mesocricetorum]|uniref:aminoacyl-tRNA hydrolase n=1 Tax=Helicobacter mesocricetorum TaxID=87012 RepID=UPI000CF16516|nr:aminoacyl-tRNA hydrolase [Helicobacter mesocricetorum]
MFLIVGLGNPGDKYKHNRHNIGFMVIDYLITSLKATKQSNKDFCGELYKSHQIFLLKPTTFMNASGESLLRVKNYYKIDNILVIHDDLDLEFGVIRFKFGGGNGGHNGLKSIDCLCGNEYYRIRYGIGKPQNKKEVIKWVLEDFSDKEVMLNEDLIKHCAKVAIEITKLENPALLAQKISCSYTINHFKKTQEESAQ